MSLACPLVYNVITQFVNAWFPDKERSLAASICGLSIPGGNLIAFILSGYIFKGIEHMDSEEVQKSLQNMILFQNLWITVICVPYFLIIRDKPEYAPSLIALESSKEMHFCHSIREALRLPQYVKLVVAFALLQGSFIAFGTNID